MKRDEIRKSIEHPCEPKVPTIRIEQIRFLLFECERLEAKVKELEEKLNTLQNHANNMGEIISNQTKIRIGLEGELTVANERIKELEGDKYELKKEIEFHIINNQSWVEECKKSNARVKELEKGIKRHKERIETIEEHMYQSKEMARMMQSVNEELYKLIEKEKR